MNVAKVIEINNPPLNLEEESLKKAIRHPPNTGIRIIKGITVF
ncbi:hypothetical protein APHCRT_0520 [Anaplasma phagocytophilum str. CRT53-1]|uniref:Uncharacterized protein n=1 Tax=Anaplasma phagocytophilum str. CRT53-1 TaxID=1359157 RepID=A0A0F3Q278_ANAPH|nr:hypothetical protein APHCRT_0520 [Anaplasma phagocytophilum str. CRT53-1]